MRSRSHIEIARGGTSVGWGSQYSERDDMSNRTNTPNMVLTLANSGKPRRPSGARVARTDDPLSSVGSAGQWLSACGFSIDSHDGMLSASELRELRKLRMAIESVTDALAVHDDTTPTSGPVGSLTVLNEIAAACPGVRRLG